MPVEPDKILRIFGNPYLMISFGLRSQQKSLTVLTLHFTSGMRMARQILATTL